MRLLYHNPLAHYVLAQGLMRLNQYPRAADALRAATALNPNFERAHRRLARYYQRVTREEDKAEAHRRLVKAIRAHNQGGAKASEGIVPNLAELVPDAEQEAQQLEFDAAPAPVVDKSAVPADPADCVVVVTGLPRSGASLMMQMLAAGRLPLLTDGKRAADGDNPKGYFELEAAARLRQDQDWLKEAQGKGVKIVAAAFPTPGILLSGDLHGAGFE